ncbi:septum formation family protein [Nocardiopsis flavescens]|uniref:septum formation family protein n=1 Tax=Nocardiopsis flavescens TaxID=758803 RepID=UPI003659B1E8
MLSELRRSPYGRLVLGPVVVGAALSLTACSPEMLLPPALRPGAEVAPSPETVETPAETPEETPAESPVPMDPEDTDVFDIFLGDCLTEFGEDEDEISSVPKIDCAEPHVYEVYHVENIDESGDYPGQDSVSTSSQELCEAEFENFVGVDYYSSALYILPLFPTAAGWDAGDREVLCLIYEPDTDTSGTLAGSNR